MIELKKVHLIDTICTKETGYNDVTIEYFWSARDTKLHNNQKLIIKEWCKKNLSSTYHIGFFTIYFTSKKDTFLYIIVWG